MTPATPVRGLECLNARILNDFNGVPINGIPGNPAHVMAITQWLGSVARLCRVGGFRRVRGFPVKPGRCGERRQVVAVQVRLKDVQRGIQR